MQIGLGSSSATRFRFLAPAYVVTLKRQIIKGNLTWHKVITHGVKRVMDIYQCVVFTYLC